MYTGNPTNNPLDRIRVYTTDTDNDDLLIEQSVIEFFYEEAGRNEKQAAVKALNYLLFQIAKMGDEKVGGVYLKNSERIKNLRLVLDDLKKDLIGIGIGSVYAGGISKSDVFNRRRNCDSIRKPTNTGDAFAKNQGGAAYVEESPFDSLNTVGIYNG
ncbi:hypothetical protein [Pectobacterium phage Wc4-1]|uniref:Uncharacterized protein n=1 Tax=Pectobacterium phage Wc4 TaxID=2652428 RepID=A0A5P8D462_9CAUD|nr:hypothetical protein [Pectobacterium phage Wc4]QFP94012.1 hypothetical protein [Pectobacterium phage Wc4-1]